MAGSIATDKAEQLSNLDRPLECLLDHEWLIAIFTRTLTDADINPCLIPQILSSTARELYQQKICELRKLEIIAIIDYVNKYANLPSPLPVVNFVTRRETDI